MPEEFRLWQERVDAASKKRPASTPGPSTPSMSMQGTAPTGSSGPGRKTAEDSKEPSAASAYATKEEALAAFRSLLHDKRISSSQKFKEVQELCSHDNRWLALSNVGERKQALAEYQTKKIKDEKEEQKIKLKKARDAFLQMLAENTEIDANTRWRTAQTLLMNDQRYKMLESERDKEDLFEEFVKELARKEREDNERARRAATELFNTIISELVAEGKIDRKTSWTDAKPLLVVSNTTHSSLSENDMRRCFNDYIDGLDRAYREEQKRLRDQERETIESRERAFKNYILSLTKSVDGEIRPLIHGKSRFADVVDAFKESSFYTELEEVYNKETADEAASRRKKTIEDFFDNMLVDVERGYKQDSKVIKDELKDVKFRFTTLSTYEDVTFALHHAADSPRSSSALKEILEKRPYNIRQYYFDTKTAKMAEEEEERKQTAKREARFIELLEDYYYRSDHVGITWEEAKDDLYKRSAYADLDRDSRKRLFEKYMAELAAKLPKKRVKQEKVEPEIEAGEIVDEEDFVPPAQASADSEILTPVAIPPSHAAMEEVPVTEELPVPVPTPVEPVAAPESGRGRSLSRVSLSPSSRSSSSSSSSSRSSSSRKQSKKRRVEEGGSGSKRHDSSGRSSKKEVM
jgi:pre-mRNA-processing factor 40